MFACFALGITLWNAFDVTLRIAYLSDPVSPALVLVYFLLDVVLMANMWVQVLSPPGPPPWQVATVTCHWSPVDPSTVNRQPPTANR